MQTILSFVLQSSPVLIGIGLLTSVALFSVVAVDTVRARRDARRARKVRLVEVHHDAAPARPRLRAAH
jgi:uncharacterized membrane protein